jgi:two-component system cell cycle sensor histidine kinase/response regulator CckA
VVHPEPSVPLYGVSKSGTPNGYINCNILSASDGENALKLLKKMDYKIDILLTDIEMPLIDGISLGEEIYKQNNRVKVIYISGYIKNFATREKRFVPNSIFLQKPFPLDVFKKIEIDTLKAEQQ